MSHWQRKRANLPNCTDKMLDVMQRCIDAEDCDLPYPTLDDVHGITINALLKRDWIFASYGKKDNRTVYMITSRGRKAAAIYADENYDTRRFDDICPDCGEAPVYYRNGNRTGYCKSCLHKLESKKWKRAQKNPDALCPRCKTRTRHVASSGRVYTYCQECKNARHRENKKRKQEKLRQRVESGEILLCQRCGKKPRHVTSSTVREWCKDCYSAYMLDYNQRRRHPEFYEELTS